MHDCCLCGRRHRETSLFSLTPAERQELGVVVKLEHPLAAGLDLRPLPPTATGEGAIVRKRKARPMESALAIQPLAAQSVIAARTDIQRYQHSLIEEAGAGIQDLEERLLKARVRLEDAEKTPPAEHQRAKEIAKRLGLRGQAWDHGVASDSYVRRLRRRVVILARDLGQALRFREAVAAGHLPMPRLPAVGLQHAMMIPVEALESLELAVASELFDEFRIVDGRDADRYGTPRRDSRARAGSDPILVGLIGTEMFPLAWWR